MVNLKKYLDIENKKNFYKYFNNNIDFGKYTKYICIY